jgi:hypothetical protein
MKLMLLIWFGLWLLTPLSTIFRLYHGGVFLVEETRGPKKTTKKTTNL